jgi:hypothetical protein
MWMMPIALSELGGVTGEAGEKEKRHDATKIS